MIYVGVIVDLYWHNLAGGHVKCWEKLAEAASHYSERLDLTVHFLDDRNHQVTLADNVRYVCHRPRFSTKNLPFLGSVPSHTDLALSNRRLIPYLEQYDVIHTTHPLFTFSQTAFEYALDHHKPLVCSIHTDLPKYMEIHSQEIIERIVLNHHLSKLLTSYLVRLTHWRLKRYHQQCSHVIGSQPEDYDYLSSILPANRISNIRLGIEKDKFHPQKRDRLKLQKMYNIPADVPLILYVGRLSPEKSVMTLAQGVRNLLDRGLVFHTLFVGEGVQRAEIEVLLPESATLTGYLFADTLPWIYACADLFVFPSPTDTYGSVLLEAKASGVPILISSQGGASQCLHADGFDGYQIDSQDVVSWTLKIGELISNPENLRLLGKNARENIEQKYPSWQEVLEEDLLQKWELRMKQSRMKN